MGMILFFPMIIDYAQCVCVCENKHTVKQTLTLIRDGNKYQLMPE